MKPATFFLALTLIPLFTTPSLSSRAIVDDTLVRDSLGFPLEKDTSYYICPISPLTSPLAGSVMLSASPNREDETCEADVVQNPWEIRLGTNFTFTPVALNEDAIKLGYPLAIQSPTVNQCEGSTVWKVSSRIGLLDSIFTTGGIINTPSSCLTITKPHEPLYPYSYIFEYCPHLCGGDFKICQPVSIYTSNNKRHLSPNGVPCFEFVLIKASSWPAAMHDLVSLSMHATDVK